MRIRRLIATGLLATNLIGCGISARAELYPAEQLYSWNGKFTKNYSRERAQGYCVPRAELDNQPMVPGYLGPMWDGDKLRYETQEIYDLLSR